MPKINVYLPDDLAEAVKDAGLPVSPICQHALELAVRQVTAIRASLRLEVDPEAAMRQTSFTANARAAVAFAVERARARGNDRITTADVLAGILGERGNLALRVLESIEVDIDIVRERLDTAAPDEDAAAVDEVFRLTVNEAITLGHNYVGCEHLLLGLVVEPNGTASALLRALGAEPRLVRRTVTATLGGYVHARGQAQPPNADALREILDPLVQRLTRLEERVGELAERP